jgi:hypothetical protein
MADLSMLKNLDSLGEQTINRIATAALSSHMKEAESFAVNVKVDPQALSKGVVSAFSMEGNNVVTAQGFRATDFSLLIENIQVHPFKALMGNIQLRQPAVGSALLGIGTQDLKDALQRNLQQSLQGAMRDDFQVHELDCHFDEPSILGVDLVVSAANSTSPHHVSARFSVGYDVNLKAIALREVIRTDFDEAVSDIYGHLQTSLLDLLNLNSLMFSGLEFDVKNIQISAKTLELRAIAKITSFPKAM